MRTTVNYNISMLDTQRINEIARTVAGTNLSSGNVVSVNSRPTLDSEGEPALRIIIELIPGSVESITGQAVMKTLSEIWEKLQEAGDDRFPFIDYATSDELDELTGVGD